MLYFEDFAVDRVFEYGSFTVTAGEIIAFAREFDPQPFHLDEDVARTSLLGGLAASGWQTAAISMRLHVQNLMHDIAALGSPGIAEMKWMKPVMKDSIVRLRVRVASARLSRTRPGMGILELDTTMLDQRGETLMTSLGTTLIASRNAPPGMQMFDPAAMEKLPAWREPDDILRDPASAGDREGILSGWYDDLTVGRTIDLGEHLFLEADMLRFAKKWDPQNFHTDPGAARAGPFGALTASGWHTCAAGMGRHVLTRQSYLAEGARRGLPDAGRGPSPGFRGLKWILPVFASDRIRYYMTPIEKRKTSRAGWGMMFTRFEGINQNARKVYEYTGISLWPVRPS